MLKASDLKKSHIIDLDGAPHRVDSISVQAPSARGGSSLYKVRFRNAVSRQKVDRVFRGDETLKEADLRKRDVQFLYLDGDRYTFMDVEDFSQFDLMADEIEEAIPYLVDDMEGITALESDGRVIGINLPDVVELEIVETDPSIKGASATARSKPATLSTGVIVQVPEYLSVGEIVRVDTRNNAFLGRA